MPVRCGSVELSRRIGRAARADGGFESIAEVRACMTGHAAIFGGDQLAVLSRCAFEEQAAPGGGARVPSCDPAGLLHGPRWWQRLQVGHQGFELGLWEGIGPGQHQSRSALRIDDRASD